MFAFTAGAALAIEAVILAQTSTDPLSPATWLQWGVLGLVLLAIATRKLVPGWALDQCEGECGRLRTELATLRQKQEESTLGTIERLTASLERATERAERIEKGAP